METANLNDQTLGEAFRKYVLEHREVANLGRRLIAQKTSYSDVFLKGQAPGPYVDFHWPINLTAEEMGYKFVSSPLVFLDEPLPVPSSLEGEAGRALASQIRVLVGRLASGEIIAVGTFFATGAEASIGAGQWRRNDLLLDVENSALCELRNHRPFPLWTGVYLQYVNQDASVQRAAVQQSAPQDTSNARKQIQTKRNCRDECLAWLCSLVADPSVVPLSNEELWHEAQLKWPQKLSQRDFIKCRANALDTVDLDRRYQWERPGPRRRSPHF